MSKPNREERRSASSSWVSWLVEMARAERLWFGGTVLFSVMGALTGALATWLMVPLAAVLFPESTGADAIHNPSRGLYPVSAGAWLMPTIASITPLSVALSFVVVFTVKNLCEFGSRVGCDALVAKVEFRLRNSLWRQYLACGRASGRSFSGARFIHELLAGAGEPAAAVGAIPVRWIGDPVAAVALLGTMAIISPHLTSAMLLLLPPAWWATRKGFRHIGNRTETRLAARGRLGARLSELASFRPVLASHAAMDWAMINTGRDEQSVIRAALSWSRVARLIPLTAETLGAFVGAAVILVVAKGIRAGTLSGGEFLTSLTAFFLLLPVAKRLAALSGDMRTSRSAWERLASLLPADARAEVAVPPSETFRAPAITLRTLRASIPGGNRVLDIGYAEFPPGEVTAIVGPTGSGKSLLLEIIAGFGVPDEGTVCWNERPISSPHAVPERLPFGYVPQDRWTISGTVGENVTLGRPVSETALTTTLQALGLDLDVQTELGQDGAPLSGGERQRLALARALLGEPPLLLLDEPTSALDAASEERVIALLRSLKGRTTVLVATHSTAVISAADWVYHLPFQFATTALHKELVT
ncbi:MAG TPA: ABC transporter ATP-binding protein [Candidatus Latescibacteria bacterium]|nr:ABC transporter ATP-binding protein [Candidatus Latescibacterota bacterium]